MKNYFRIFLFLFLSESSFCLEANTYSISVCTTSSKEAANGCKKDILKTSKSEAFILENSNGTYSTYLGKFSTYDEAKKILNTSSNFIKKQKPFVKKITRIEKDIKEINEKIKDETAQPFAEEIKKKAAEELQRLEKEETLAEIQKLEKEKSLADAQKLKDEKDKLLVEEQRKKFELEIQKIKEEKDKALAEIQKLEKEKSLAETQKIKEEKAQPKLNELINLNNFENLIITIDSKKNIMEFKGQNNTELINIKTYKVSTAKASIKKPLGEGYITSISLNPEWYPTLKTLKAFKEKGISLPSIVPFGDKLNYMGAAKISLSHKVDGQEVYRIHGTLNEDSIGTNESSGCIRMRNKDVYELATLLNQYANLKKLNSIKVILL